MLRGDALKNAARQLAADLRAKRDAGQQGVGTYADLVWLAFIAELERLDGPAPWEDRIAGPAGSPEAIAFERLRALLTRRSQGRFVDYELRMNPQATGANGPSDVGYFDMVMSQGAVECLQWKGRPLFKTVYDFSLYPMLIWALKPATVFELGSGAGASAAWMADLMRDAGVDGHVYSLDLERPDLVHPGVTFLEGDCETIDRAFGEPLLRTAPHPWLVVEDAHVNVVGVLRHFHRHTAPGDYVIVEDSAGKHEELRHFLAREPGCYRVDTYFTDFFGRNATCAQDSILVRMPAHD